ncbi:MAG: serine/threonine protein kinase [Planctomycetes bacterium]|nr:serine/threonine protein kinase [Planctomycetota bacterium]
MTVDVQSGLADGGEAFPKPASVEETLEFNTAEDTGPMPIPCSEETVEESPPPAARSAAAKPSTLIDDEIMATVEVAWIDASAEDLDAGGFTVDVDETRDKAAGDGATLHDKTIKSPVGAESTVDERPLYVADRTVVARTAIVASPELAASRAEYELGPELGSGGIGVVYEARQTSINRSVAVKMLQEEEAGSNRSGKFLEEAIITGELDHPNIVPIYDLGRASDGRLFYAMKQVRGTPWKDVLHAQEMHEKLRILLRSSDAVAFAHSRGVVHRDLKPENIMLGEFGEVLVMDWGLALHRDRHNDKNSALGGTPGFMAPEMVLGPISAIGPHSDIYLLGAILFQIITGYPPHAGQNQMGCLLNAARNRIEPTDKTGELLDIAMKALSKDPAGRHARVKEFQAAIRDYQSHEESLELEEIAREGAKKARETGDYLTFSEAVHSFENALRLWDGNENAHTGLSETRGEYARAARDKGDFDLGLSVLQPEGSHFNGLRDELRTGLAEREARAEKLQRAKKIGVGLVASLLIVMTVSAIWINSARKTAEDNATEAAEQRDLAEKNLSQADRNFKLAKQAVDEMLTKSAAALEDEPGQHELRQVFLRNAQSLYATLVLDRPDDPELQREMGRAWHRLGEINRDLGEVDEATTAFSRGIAILKELLEKSGQDADLKQQLAATYGELGENYRTLEANSDAERHFDLALSLLDELTGTDTGKRLYQVMLGRTLNNRGLVYYATNRQDKADEAFSRVLADLQKLSLEDDTRQELARAALNRGNINTNRIQTEADRLAIARQDYERAVSLLEELRKSSPRKATYRLDLSRAHLALGNLHVRDRENRDLEKAESRIQTSVELADGLVTDFEEVNEYRRERDNALNSLAAVYYYQDKFDEAAEAWDRVREDAQRLFDEQPEVPDNQSQLGRALSNLGVAHNTLQNFDQARDYLHVACDHLREVTKNNTDNPDYRRYLRNALRSLTTASLGLGHHQAARDSALELVQLYPEVTGELYRESRDLSLCVAALEKDASLTDARRMELRVEYLGEALRLLEKAARLAAAADRNFKREIITAQKNFDAIRDEPGFEAVLKIIDGL